MRPTGPDLLQAIADATIGCRNAEPGPDLDGALDTLCDAIEAYAPLLEADRDYRGRGAVHGIADRWLGGVRVARMLAWKGEPAD
jgi:hypothetical protein